MDKKIVGLVGAISAFVPLGGLASPATAAPNGVLAADSYADLLKPIPNAVEGLKASDAALQDSDAKVETVQYHHHHHHHHFMRRFFHPRYHHHHHHHFYHHHHHHFY